MIKNTIILFLILFCPMLYGQEISIQSAEIATAGINDDAELSQTTVNISKWRIGEVYLLTIPGNTVLAAMDNDMHFEAYPNPCRNELNLKILGKEATVATVHIFDVAGKMCQVFESRSFMPNQESNLDLSKLKTGMYLLTVTPEDKNKKWMVKIQKQ